MWKMNMFHIFFVHRILGVALFVGQARRDIDLSRLSAGARNHHSAASIFN